MRTPRTERHGDRRTSRQLEVLSGRNAVREALLAGRRRFGRLLLADGLEPSRRVTEIEQLAAQRRLSTLHLPRPEIEARGGPHSQGIALEVGPFPYIDSPDLAVLAAAQADILALDGIADPRNVGALLRSADATGFHHIVIPNDRAAGVTPIVSSASAGAVEHLDIWHEVNLARWLKRAQSVGYWVAGLASDGDAVPLFDVDLRSPLVLVIGAEGSGIRRLVREACDLIVSIPMYGRVESLNASVAGALAMYEVRRWRDDTAETVEPLDA